MNKLQRSLIICPLLCLPGTVHAQKIGGADSPDISIGYILLMLMLCIIMAFLVIFVLRRYVFGMVESEQKSTSSSIPIMSLFSLGKMGQSQRSIDIVSSRKVAQHCDIVIIRCADQEYVLASGPSHIIVLSEKYIEPEVNDATD